MRTFLLIIIISILFSGCGKKDTPEYQSQNIYSKNIYII